jgi:hypothetical protein
MIRQALITLTFVLATGLGISSVFSQTPPNTTQLQPAPDIPGVIKGGTMRFARGSEKMTPTFGSQKASSALVRPLITTSGIVPPLMTLGMSGAG